MMYPPTPPREGINNDVPPYPPREGINNDVPPYPPREGGSNKNIPYFKLRPKGVGVNGR